MDPVAARHAAIFETEAAEQRVRLNDVLDRLGQRAAFGGVFGGERVAQEDIVAGPRKREARGGRREAGGDKVSRIGLDIGARLEPCR